MAVLVLMYHRTPALAPESEWDVGMPVFREQILRLLDGGYEFVRFGDAMNAQYYSGGVRICVTFDDGHESNCEAIEFLRGLDIVPTAFIVSEWSSQQQRGAMSAGAIAGFRDHCDFGGHGATHTGLTGLTESQLQAELRASRLFLEETLQRDVVTMSVPGGLINRRVIDAAHRSGFRVIGTSLDVMNLRPSPVLDRICVRSGFGAEHLVEMTRQSRFYWRRRRVRLHAAHAVSRMLTRLSYLCSIRS